jgi:hypothetical protein
MPSNFLFDGGYCVHVHLREVNIVTTLLTYVLHNFRDNTWTVHSPLQHARYWHTMAVLNGRQLFS